MSLLLPGRSRPAEIVRALAAEQAGIISRRQARDAGMSSSAIARRVAEGSWRVVHPGVYLVDTTALTSMGRVWAAVLYAQSPTGPDTGRDAAIAGMAALWLAGVVDECPAVVDAAVPMERRVRSRAGVRIARRVTLPVQPARKPPRLRLEEALLDVAGRCTEPERVVDLVLAAGQRRLTTPQRVLAAVERRPRLRWRCLVRELCDELEEGVHSPLERHYGQLERRHGLPAGERNVREAAPVTGSWFRDVRYRKQRLIVELDGRGAHPTASAFRDRRRDNHAAQLGETTLRYGWREVMASPCEIAAEVAQVLALGGWTGRPRPCGPSCAVHALDASHQSDGSVPLSGSDPPRSRHAG